MEDTIKEVTNLMIALAVITGMMIFVAIYEFADGQIWQGIADTLFAVSGFMYITFVKKATVLTFSDTETDDDAEKTAFAAGFLMGKFSGKTHDCKCDKEEDGKEKTE